MDLRCHHCGRRVCGTIHLRNEARVDYYKMHTGLTEPVVIEDREGTGESIHFDRLLVPQEILTCADCMALPEVADHLDHAWRQGLPTTRGATSRPSVDGRACL